VILGPLTLKPNGGIDFASGKVVPHVPGLGRTGEDATHYRQNGDLPNRHFKLPATTERLEALLFLDSAHHASPKQVAQCDPVAMAEHAP
jgi:hypothetical protein